MSEAVSDIVERLRSWQGNLCNSGTPKAECWEAADEIESLRSRLAEAEALLREAAGWRVAIECVAPELGGTLMTLSRIDAFLAEGGAEPTKPCYVRDLSGDFLPQCDKYPACICGGPEGGYGDQPGEAVK